MRCPGEVQGPDLGVRPRKMATHGGAPSYVIREQAMTLGPDASAPHPFDLATALVLGPDNVWRGATNDAYWNMIGPFGGLVAALLFRSVFDHPDRQGLPVALTVNFCAALKKGDFTIRARPARTNRSTQHWTMELVQGDDGIFATGTAIFGARPETFSHFPAAAPLAPSFEGLERTAVQGSDWVGRYDLRFAEGALQRAGARQDVGSARSLLWIRDDPPRLLDFVGLAALCDIFFGRIIHVRQRMVPFGTITMSAFFHASEADLAGQGDAPLLGLADARVFERGYHDQSAELWSTDGHLLATSHQAVYYRDPQARA
jgi:acyl-CoA thioesterase